MKIFILFVISYLFGSISFAFLFTYFLKGKDIRKIGDGNPGAANVARNVGKIWGIVVWAGDTLKGVLPIFIGKWWGIENIIILTFIGCFAILGHCYSIFLKFKGGKGAATSGGVILCLMPFLFPLVIILWFIAQKINPRSPKVLLSCVVIFFVFLFFVYRDKFFFYSISTLLLILTGVIVNKNIITEMRRRKIGNMEKKNL